MIASFKDTCAFATYGLLLPALGFAVLHGSLFPLVYWLIACSLVVASYRESRHD